MCCIRNRKETGCECAFDRSLLLSVTYLIWVANKFATLKFYYLQYRQHFINKYIVKYGHDSQRYDKLSLMTNQFLMNANWTNLTEFLMNLDSFVCSIFFSLHCNSLFSFWSWEEIAKCARYDVQCAVRRVQEKFKFEF